MSRTPEGPTPERSVTQAPRFARSKRRLPTAVQLAVDEAVRGLLQNPLAGEPKVGALRGVRVVTLKVGAQQLLLAYQFAVLDIGKYLDAR